MIRENSEIIFTVQYYVNELKFSKIYMNILNIKVGIL